MKSGHSIKVLDHGYVKLIDSMGNDEAIIEAARMSTGKGFFGWFWEEDTFNDSACAVCKTQHIFDTLPVNDEAEESYMRGLRLCTNCWSMEVYHVSLVLTPLWPSSLRDMVEW